MRTPCCTTDPRDLVANRRASLLLWKLPLAVFVAGFFVSSITRTVIWATSLVVAGTACLINAHRCRRVHCYFTGPFFLIGAAASVADGLGVLPLGTRGWIWIGLAVILGSCILTVLSERLWGRYADGSAGYRSRALKIEGKDSSSSRMSCD